MSVILDASALLAFLKSEPGAEIVQGHLRRSSLSAVSLLEVLVASGQGERRIEKVIRLLRGYQVEIVPFDEQLALAASALNERIGDLDVSFAGRMCLALATVRQRPVLTTDRLWSSLPLDIEVILIGGEPN